MKIMVFLHGTALMHRAGDGRTQEERVQQVRDRDKSIYDFGSYVPVGGAVEKLRTWSAQGAGVLYLSSQKKSVTVEQDKHVLKNYHFPVGPVYFRQGGEAYQEVIERAQPDILIEDDCESIAGEVEMTYPHLRLELRSRIKSIVVEEFGGIDHLPGELAALVDY